MRVVPTSTARNLYNHASPANGSQLLWNGSQLLAVNFDIYSVITVSPDGENWTDATALMSGVSYLPAWNGSVYCAISATEAFSYTSPDGIVWTPNDLPDTVGCDKVRWTGSLFVIGQAASSNAYTSPDGITWTTRAFPSALGGFYTETFQLGGKVFVTDRNTAKVMSSADGIAWLEGAFPSTGTWSVVGWNGSVFLAIQQFGSTAAATSPDGITWTTRTLAHAWNSHAIGVLGSLFVVGTGGANVITSPDGITWSTRTTAYNTDTDVCWVGDKFVCLNITGRNVSYSADGITWSGVTTGAYYAAGTSIVWTGTDIYVSHLHSSDGGMTWEEQRLVGSCSLIIHGEYLNGKFVGIAEWTYLGNVYFESPDGKEFTRVVPIAMDYPSRIGYGAGLYVILSYNQSSDFLTSPDGITWTSRNMAHGFGLSADLWQHIIWNGTKFCAMGQNGDYSATSSDGITWSVVATGFSSFVSAYNGNNLAWGNGRFVVGLRGFVLFSTNGIAWSVSTTSCNVLSMVFQDGYFYASSIAGYPYPVIRSDDGDTWIDLGPTYQSNFVLAKNASGLLACVNNFTGGGFYGICDPWILFMDLDGKIISKVRQIEDYALRAYRPIYRMDGNDLLMIGGERLLTYTCIQSDMVEIQPIADVEYWSCMTHANGLFLAIGDNPSYNEPHSAYSVNGVDWTEGGRLPFGHNYYYQLAYGNGRWVTPSWDGSNSVAVSLDNGLTWAAHALPASADAILIAFNGTMFCILSYNDTKSFTSADGITWVAHTITARDWQWMAAKGGVFYALEYPGAVYSSPDGITWTACPLVVTAGENLYTLETDGSVVVVFGTYSSYASIDGVTWVRTLYEAGVDAPQPSNLYAGVATYDGSRFLAFDNLNASLLSSVAGGNWDIGAGARHSFYIGGVASNSKRNVIVSGEDSTIAYGSPLGDFWQGFVNSEEVANV